jgi:hypothetical protein
MASPIDDLGYWDDETFVFDPPIYMSNGARVRKLDCSRAELEAGIDITDVIYSVAHNLAVVEE